MRRCSRSVSVPLRQIVLDFSPSAAWPRCGRYFSFAGKGSFPHQHSAVGSQDAAVSGKHGTTSGNGHASASGFRSLGNGFAKKVQKDLSSAASTVQAVVAKTSESKEHARGAPASMHQEHCLLGWAPEEIYKVVADVAQYSAFLPWCVAAVVDTCDAPFPHAQQMTATLGVGFSFLREQYKSDVTLSPMKSIRARLHGSSTLLQELHCDWYFDEAAPSLLRQHAPMLKPIVGGAGAPAPVSSPIADVRFEVRFSFRNPLHQSLSSLVMSNVVTVMTASFEKRCAELYGPPRCPRASLPLQLKEPVALSQKSTEADIKPAVAVPLTTTSAR